MPSHVESRTRLFGRPFGNSAFRSRRLSPDCNMFSMQLGSRSNVENMSERRSRAPVVGSTTLGIESRLNQDLISNNHINKSIAPRTFGLQSRISSSIPSLQLEDSLRMNRITDNLQQRNNISAISRTFGLVPEETDSLSLHNNERINQDLRRINNVDSSILQRPLGLQTRNIPSHSHLFSQNNFSVNLGNNITDYRRSNINVSTSGLNILDNGGFNQDSRKNSSYRFGLLSRNLTLHSDVCPDGDLRLNQESNQRNNCISTVPKTFGCSDDIIDDERFRRANMSRVIKGRNSTLSSRFFHNQNTRHCRDLSNMNGFNVSHISRRDVDVLSESRFALNMRSNCTDNQSIAGSIMSGSSMKSQFLNLLENLHHSILNIGPNVTADAVRMEFDRAKQRLENISEMSFAPLANEVGATSVINQSSKYICPPIDEPMTTNTIDGGSLHLKSSKDLLKTLISGKNEYKSKFVLSTPTEEEEERRKSLSVTPSQKTETHDEQDSNLLFKKPRPYIRKKKNPRSLKIKTVSASKLALREPMAQVVKSLTAKTASKMINLRQWYPIAVGSDLALCGVDDQGAFVKTEAVKKRLNNRKIELITGLGCNLIGSPSAAVSVLPKKIIGLLKNGLTDRWRVLQKELLNCQTAEGETKRRKSRSPNAKISPEKKKEKAPKKMIKKGKYKSPKVISTPKKRGEGMFTRSGRTVKPPGMFWIVTRSEEVTSSLPQPTSETKPSELQSGKKSEKTPVKKSKEATPPNKKKKVSKKTPKKKAKPLNDSSPRKCKKGNEESSVQTAKASADASPRAKKAASESFETPKAKPSKMKSPKGVKRKDGEEVKVHSSTDDVKRQTKTRQPRGKRKREIVEESDSFQAKKSKLEKNTELEVESTVEAVERGRKREKKKAIKHSPKYSRKPKHAKSPSVKEKNKTVKKKEISKNVSEGKKEAQEITEFEDFEFKLDDIEIPEIANVSGNPQLSRSQLRLISMETPPLKYFNSNLRLLRSATPVRSPDWCISQRTESEVKQFQKRREEAFKKKTTVEVKKTIITEKSKNCQSKDVKRVMEWVAEKAVRSPQWNSKLLQYVLPSRRQMEQEDDGEEEEEDVENGFL